MDKTELIERLRGYEWNDVEFKEARRAVPKNAYETVSAFANTEGGSLVFGVRDSAGGFEIVGVLNVDRVQNDFLSALRSGQKLNRVIAVDERLIRARKAFQLTLLKEELLSEEQLLFQAKLGVHLDEAEAKAFAFACLHGRLGSRDVRAIAGLSGADAVAVLDRLASQALISPLEGAETPMFVLAEHLRDRLGRTDEADDLAGTGEPGLVTDQAGPESGGLVTDQARPGPEGLSTAQVDGPSEGLSTEQADRLSGSLSTTHAGWPSESLSTAQAEPLTKLTASQRKIIEICDVPRSLTAIMSAVGVAGRGYFKSRHLDPLLRGGVLRMIHPDQPRHPAQAYVLTGAGAKLKAGEGNRDAARVDGDRTNGA